MNPQPEDRATDRPEVVTAAPEVPQPPRNGIPAHLGPARTSTVVLAVLFLAIGALYLNVRPDPVRPATTGGGGSVEQPADPPTSVAPTTTPPTTTDPAEPTESEPVTTEPTTTEPTGEAPATGVPTSPQPTGAPTVPPTGTPPG